MGMESALMRSDKLGELAAMALVAGICLCYAVNSRAQPPISAIDAKTSDLEFEGTPFLKVEVFEGAVQSCVKEAQMRKPQK